MIFQPQSYFFMLQDALYSMAVGFVCALFAQVLSVFLHGNRIAAFAKDMLVSRFFRTALFSYCVSFANYRLVRLYNVFFALIGLVCFSPVFARPLRKIIACAGNYAARAAAAQLKKGGRYISRSMQKQKVKNEQKRQEKDKELLKKPDIVLYN